ncbi:MAG TPA: hypothetical protein VFW40_12080 [Capsulimonadaceae bacterium]|nr:hypothetical protein [Capsulimonadaceae bacterium]
MDDFRPWKSAAAFVWAALFLLALLSCSQAYALSGEKTAHLAAKTSPASADFYHYGFVCGQNDAEKGDDATGSLSVTASAEAYIAQPAHRQELPRGQALALSQLAKKASPAKRGAYLKAFLAGYHEAWKQMSAPVGGANTSPAGSRPSRRVVEEMTDNPNDPSLQNLRTLGSAVRLYLSDHNNTFPRMVSPTVADKYFQHYLLDNSAFYEPGTGDPYQPNLALENRHFNGYLKANKTVVYFEADPASDGSRCVLFMDGTAARVPASLWPAVKEDSQIPDQP